MIYTVYDMVREELIPGIKPLTKGIDFSAKEISSVSVQEYPSDNFVQAGELVLSTAAGCTDNEETLCAFLSELAARGASGVLFAFKDAAFKMPKSSLVLAMQLELPIFSIPWELRFSQIQTDLIRILHKRNIDYISEIRLKNDFVWDLSSGKYRSNPLMYTIGKRLGFDLTPGYICISMEIQPLQNYSPDEYYANSEEYFAELENAATHSARLMGIGIMQARRSYELVLYIENRPSLFPEGPGYEAGQYINRLKAKLEKLSQSCSICIGLSYALASPSDFETLYNQASLALRYAKAKPGSWNVFTYADAKEARLISCLKNSLEIEEMASDILYYLAAGSPGKKTALMDTLIEYIRCRGNASQAAKNLYIHRQTLLQRLKRIEELSGMSLECSRDMFILECCARLFYDI